MKQAVPVRCWWSWQIRWQTTRQHVSPAAAGDAASDGASASAAAPSGSVQPAAATSLPQTHANVPCVFVRECRATSRGVHARATERQRNEHAQAPMQTRTRRPPDVSCYRQNRGARRSGALNAAATALPSVTSPPPPALRPARPQPLRRPTSPMPPANQTLLAELRQLLDCRLQWLLLVAHHLLHHLLAALHDTAAARRSGRKSAGSARQVRSASEVQATVAVQWQACQAE